MNDSYPQPPPAIANYLRSGLVIPAHPLALTKDRRLDEQRQCALTRYYLAAGAGGVAVGVHTTQFAIREPQHQLLRPVLELASLTVEQYRATDSQAEQPHVLIAGLCGDTRQATDEAVLASGLGYHAGLLSLAALQQQSEVQLLEHARQVALEIPLVGFYLQPSVGGRRLSYSFWREFCQIPNVLAIKVAPFNRYQTLDVVRAVADSGRAEDIALYTGNDDSIVVDLLCQYRLAPAQPSLRFVGGLLGHWACWTRAAVALFRRIQQVLAQPTVEEYQQLLTVAQRVTDMNAAVFDAAGGYRGCIAGVHEVLRRQGLLAGTWCLDPQEQLSPGQADEITRVWESYPELTDDGCD